MGISIKNVSYSFKMTDDDLKETSFRAIENINIDIREGEFISIIGKNGSGKSTLAKTFNGLIIPDTGDVIVDGLNTREENNLLNIRKNVGMVFQNPDNQIVSSIVEEEVAFGLENLGVDTKDMRKRVDLALEMMGLIEYKRFSPNKLSGGQKQRLALASIIAMKPKFIVLDEPTAMLDPKARKNFIETVIKLNKEEKITIILITHYMDEIIKSDRVLVMDDGIIAKEGTVEEIFDDREIEKYGIVLPKLINIKNELEKKGFHIEKKIFTVDDFVNCIG